MGKPVKITMLTDSRDSVRGFEKAGKAAEQASGRLDTVAESSDRVASKGAQAAGALSGLGGLVGGKFGAAMEAGGIATQALADSGDLLNVVTESAILRKAKDTAMTIRQTVATKAKVVADKAAAGASKAWAASQWLLNAALTANPIGLVVVAVAALVAGLVIAYKKSETFRKIVDGAFAGISKAAKVMWEKGIRPYFKLIANIWLTVVGVLVNGAAKAFGWVPGIGGKLKKAAAKFNEFKTTVNRALDGVKKDVNVTVHMKLDSSSYVAGLNSLPLMPGGTGGGTTPRTSTSTFSRGSTAFVEPAAAAQPLIVIENVNLEVPVGASAEDIGREFVGYISAYYQVGGTRL